MVGKLRHASRVVQRQVRLKAFSRTRVRALPSDERHLTSRCSYILPKDAPPFFLINEVPDQSWRYPGANSRTGLADCGVALDSEDPFTSGFAHRWWVAYAMRNKRKEDDSWGSGEKSPCRALIIFGKNVGFTWSCSEAPIDCGFAIGNCWKIAPNPTVMSRHLVSAYQFWNCVQDSPARQMTPS